MSVIETLQNHSEDTLSEMVKELEQKLADSVNDTCPLSYILEEAYKMALTNIRAEQQSRLDMAIYYEDDEPIE